jgi:hypothetical protein
MDLTLTFFLIIIQEFFLTFNEKITYNYIDYVKYRSISLLQTLLTRI